MVKRLLNLKICPKKLQGEYIWRQDVSLQWCKGSKSLLSERFGCPYGRPGDSFCIRETLGLSGRVGMYGKLSTLLKGDTKSALLIFGGMDTQGEIFNDSFLLLPSFRQ